MRGRLGRIASFLGVAMIGAACSMADPETVRVAQHDGVMRLANVGASVTRGAGLKNRDRDNISAQLGRMLGDKWEVRNFGVGGSGMLKRGNKPYWKQKAYADALAFEPHVVTICLGGNDVKPNNWQHKDEFVADCLDMVDAFARLPSKPRIYLCYPAPAYPERWGISDEVMKSELVPLIDKAADTRGLSVIDLREPLIGKGEFFPDKVHPDVRGATIMARTIYQALTGEDWRD